MKIIISPAKKLNSDKISVKNYSEVKFKSEAKSLVNKLKSLNIDDISKLMGISKILAELNFQRFQNWDLKSQNVNPALFMFNGDVYKALNVKNFKDDDLIFAQDNLRIISGLYGILKPLDLIFPYRLEMGANLETEKASNLYEFWGNKLHDHMKSEMADDEILINLASDEYSKAINLDKFDHKVIKPIFKDYKNGKFKVISFFAKKARGEMAKYIIKNKISKYQDLKLFSSNGYSFSDEIDNGIVFSR